MINFYSKKKRTDEKRKKKQQKKQNLFERNFRDSRFPDSL